MHAHHPLTAAIAALAVVVAPASAWQDGPVTDITIEVGALPAYAFRSPPLNVPAIRSLEDLRGRPVLVGFWGTRCGVCVGGAVPSVLNLSEHYGGDLEVLLVESWAEPSESAAYALGRRWLATSAMWTSEVPFQPAASLPRCVLLDAEGRVVLEGNPLTMKVAFEREVEHQVQLARRPPEDTPTELKGAWVEFHKGKIGRALQLAARVAERTEDEVLRASAIATGREFRQRTDARIDRIDRLIEAGYFVRAEQLALEMQKGLSGDEALEQRVDAVLDKLSSDELKPEVEAAKKLYELESTLFSNGTSEALVKKLQRFVERYPETRASERARQLLNLASIT